MALPQNITKHHLTQAAERIIKEGIPKRANSKKYDVSYKDKLLPSKLIVSYANLYANGEELDRARLNGGLKNECIKLLENNGFTIMEKSGYSKELVKFLAQAQTKNLKTLSFRNEYLGIRVKVSFGQGFPARIPWISFLGKNQRTSEGIYPGYLFYKSVNKLILSYCVSETKQPSVNWKLPDSATTIAAYFKEHDLGKAERYGNSFVYKVYDVESLPSETELDKDLKTILQFYKEVLETPHVGPIMEKFDYKAFSNAVKEVGLRVNEKLIMRFIASLCTKPFVILTGLSGSGKTKLAQAFAKWICESEAQYKLIPVGADWTNREPLLGYPNALEPGKYVLPDSGVLNLILEASKDENRDKPFFIILDEMNLSHVERYFADFLSAMESGEEIPLHSGLNWQDEVPSSIFLPTNLFIVGTVNIDETTYMFSPKVLDRASVIEFRISQDEMVQYLQESKRLNFENLNGLGAEMGKAFLNVANNWDIKPMNTDDLTQALIAFFAELKVIGAEFGYRSASEIYRFAAVASALNPGWKLADVIDSSIMQKLLPKVHGSRRKMEPVLRTLGALCLANGKNIDDIFNRKAAVQFSDPTISKYPLSLEKIDCMYHGLISNGFTSYTEV